MIVDPATFRFLTEMFPQLRLELPLAGLLIVLVLIWIWRLDPFTLRRQTSLIAGAACFAGLSALSLATPELPNEPFQGIDQVSNFVRSGVISTVEYVTHGFIDAGAPGTAPALPVPAQSCRPAARLPARRRLSAAGGRGGGGRPARCDLRGAEAHPSALQRRVLRVRRRVGGAPLQPHADG